jgi:hypothetical protein
LLFHFCYFACVDPGSTTITTSIYLTNDEFLSPKSLSTLVNQLPTSNKMQNNFFLAMHQVSSG